MSLPFNQFDVSATAEKIVAENFEPRANQSSSKRTAQNEKSTEMLSKRKCTRTQTLDSSSEDETNDDQLFEDAIKESQSKEDIVVGETEKNTPPSEAKKEEGNALSLLTPGEKLLYKILMDLRTDVKVIQKTIINAELKNCHTESKRKEYGVVEKERLQRFGLPLTDENSVIGFNIKLKEKKFHDDIVS